MATVDERVARIEAQLDTVAAVLDGKPAPTPGGGNDPALALRVADLEECVRRLAACTYEKGGVYEGGKDVSGGSRAYAFILAVIGGWRRVGEAKP